MKFLILGSGGREVGIAKCLTKHKVYCISNYLNKQMDELVEEYIIFKELYNTFKLRKLILDKKPEIVIIGSEKFLESGIVDILVKNNIGCIGPKKRLADIELSKTFARKFLSFNNLEKYNPKYDIVHNYDKKNLDKLFSSYSYDFVLKDDGLCGGKGVKLFNYDNYDLAFPYSKSILEKNNVLLSNIISESFFSYNTTIFI